LIGLVLWYLFQEANIAIFFSILSEGFATLPTILKAYHHPETEEAWPWLATVINGVLTLVTITTFDFAHLAFPVFYSFEMFAVYFFVRFKIGKRKYA
jgi:hypothetical protein